MNPEEIGALLRAGREEQGINLSTVQKDTKIRYKYLEAMEAGDFDVIQAPVYLRGFIRSYAAYLGLDSEQLVDAYDQWLAEQHQSTAAGEDAARKVQWMSEPAANIPSRTGGGGGRPVRWLIPLLVVLVVIASIIVWAANHQNTLPANHTTGNNSVNSAANSSSSNQSSGNSQASSQKNQAASGASNQEANTSQTSNTASNSSQQSQQAASQPAVKRTVTGRRSLTYTVSGSQSLVVTLKAVGGNCWLNPATDGHGLAAFTLKQGQSRVFKAASKVTFRAGNPGALEVTVNGQSMGHPATTGVWNVTVQLVNSGT